MTWNVYRNEAYQQIIPTPGLQPSPRQRPAKRPPSTGFVLRIDDLAIPNRAAIVDVNRRLHSLTSHTHTAGTLAHDFSTPTFTFTQVEGRSGPLPFPSPLNQVTLLWARQ